MAPWCSAHKDRLSSSFDFEKKELSPFSRETEGQGTSAFKWKQLAVLTPGAAPNYGLLAQQYGMIDTELKVMTLKMIRPFFHQLFTLSVDTKIHSL